MTTDAEPKLAPPGAGLPKIELLIGQMLFGLKRLLGNRGSFDAEFAREREAVRRLLAGRSPAELSQRVLIERPRGLEDSSRYWSAYMALEHLRIVHNEMARVIGNLAREEMPAGTASTAAVKPGLGIGGEIVADFEASCDLLLRTVAAAPNLKTATRFAHPWFGPLDAHGWHALSGGHLRIHRVQIERILAGLKA